MTGQATKAVLGWRLLAVFLSGLATTPGCEDKRRHRSSEDIAFSDVEAPVPNDASPEEVARSLLNTLKELNRIRRIGLGTPEQKEHYDRTMGELMSLAAREQIHEGVKKKGSAIIPKDVSANAAVRLVVESWASIVGHYVDGFLFDTISVTSGGDEVATVRVQAENPKERELLDEIEASPEIAGAKDKDGNPLPKNGPEYMKLVRPKALAKGFNVPIRTEFKLQLRKVDDAWRVSQLTIGPVASRLQATTITIPAGPTMGPSANPSTNP